MAEREKKQRSSGRSAKKTEDQATNEEAVAQPAAKDGKSTADTAPASQGASSHGASQKQSGAELEQADAELDEMLDEIDEVLESNAEEFVKNYVQKGGQ